MTGTLVVRKIKLKLPEGAQNDRLNVRAFLLPGPGSDGFDPMQQGLGLVLTGIRFDLPASGFTGTPGRWRYRDPSGLGSNADGITNATLRLRRDGNYKLAIRGRDVDLSAFDGTMGQTIHVRVEIGNDHAAANLAFRRKNRDLTHP